MDSLISEPDGGALTSIAKFILDLDQLVTLLRKSTPRSKPWQRLLLGHLDAVDRASQVLRMTIVMDREDTEVLAAAEQVHAACRVAAGSVGSTRADLSSRAALSLMMDLATGIRSAMRRHVEGVGEAPADVEAEVAIQLN